MTRGAISAGAAGRGRRCAKVYGLIGLCAKKGSVVSGADACENAIRNGVDGIMILAGDSSGNTKQKFIRLSQDKGVEYIIFGSCSELGRRIGRGERSVMIINDRGLSREIRVLLGLVGAENGGAEFGKNQSL